MANPEHVEILKQGAEVWNEWREENPEVKPDLSEENFSDANFSADLTGANFMRANLTGANLTEAILARAILMRAILKGANLTGANLTGGYLTGANLTAANLRETDFKDTTVGYTVFANVDINEAKNLGSIKHGYPSTIGVDTLQLAAISLYRDPSNGGEIETFFRGAGVPDDFIDTFKTHISKPIEFFSCFISYSHEDKPFARRLHDQLQAKGIRCWLDEHLMLPGDDIYEQIDKGIKLWDKVLLCCSKHSLSSWWVNKEINTAFNKEQRLFKERKKQVLCLIPLNLDGYMFDGEWESGKEIDVKSRIAADFTGWESDNAKFEAEFKKVVKALRTDDQAREKAPEPKL